MLLKPCYRIFLVISNELASCFYKFNNPEHSIDIFIQFRSMASEQSLLSLTKDETLKTISKLIHVATQYRSIDVHLFSFHFLLLNWSLDKHFTSSHNELHHTHTHHISILMSFYCYYLNEIMHKIDQHYWRLCIINGFTWAIKKSTDLLAANNYWQRAVKCCSFVDFFRERWANTWWGYIQLPPYKCTAQELNHATAIATNIEIQWSWFCSEHR